MSGNIHAEQTKGVQDEDVHSHWQLACQGVGLHCFTQNRLAFMFYGTYTKSPCPKKRPSLLKNSFWGYEQGSATK